GPPPPADGGFDPALDQVAHRQWPLPDRPWVMTQSWHDLLFAHWRVDERLLRPHVPAAFDLDRFDGSAWLGVVPFTMSRVAPRGERSSSSSPSATACTTSITSAARRGSRSTTPRGSSNGRARRFLRTP